MVPSMYFDNALSVPNALHVTGACLPGVPFVWMGRNRDITWSFTPTGVDTEDLFVEHLKERMEERPLCAEGKGDGMDCPVFEATVLTYLHGEVTGENGVEQVWSDVRVESEEFLVVDRRSSAAPEPELRTIDVFHTARGPLILPFVTSSSGKALHAAGRHLSLSSAARHGTFRVSGLQQLNTAATWDTFREGLHGFESTALNVLFGDVQGNIASTVTGRLPVRVGDHSGDKTSEGYQYGWLDTESALDCANCEAVPYRSFNPKGGLIASVPWYKIDKSIHLSELRKLQVAADQAASAISIDSAVALDCGNVSNAEEALAAVILEATTSVYSTTEAMARDLLQSDVLSSHMAGLRRVFLEAFRIEVASGLLRPLKSSADAFRGESHTALKLSGVLSGCVCWCVIVCCVAGNT